MACVHKLVDGEQDVERQFQSVFLLFFTDLVWHRCSQFFGKSIGNQPPCKKCLNSLSKFEKEHQFGLFSLLSLFRRLNWIRPTMEKVSSTGANQEFSQRAIINDNWGNPGDRMVFLRDFSDNLGGIRIFFY